MDKDSKRDISYLATTEQHYSITACSGKSQRQGAKAATQATYPTTSQTAMQSLFNLVNPLSHRHASVDIGQSVQKSKKRSIHQSLRNIPTNTTTMHIRRSTARPAPGHLALDSPCLSHPIGIGAARGADVPWDGSRRWTDGRSEWTRQCWQCAARCPPRYSPSIHLLRQHRRLCEHPSASVSPPA